MHIARKLLIALPITLVLAVVAIIALLSQGNGTAVVPRGMGSPTTTPTQTASASRSDVMVALGDSLTAASNSCGKHNACKDNSWATGMNPAVDSVAARIEAATGKTLKIYNYAHIGDKVGALDGQLDKAIALQPGIVTILIGSNDFCTDNVNQMTDDAEFNMTFQAALTKLHTALPDTKILVASTINPASLWSNLRDNTAATTAWARGLCGAMLANATSNDDAAQQQRQSVVDKSQTINKILADVCGNTPSCYFTDSVYGFQYTTATVSAVDYIHPNLTGQATLANLVFSAPGVKDFLTR